MASVPISSCDVFVNIIVDSSVFINNQSAGVWAVDNQLQNGSTNERLVVFGTFQNPPSAPQNCLTTAVTVGSNICWSIQDVNINSGYSFEITEMTQLEEWKGNPPSAPGTAQNIWTGAVIGNWNTGTQIIYGLTFNTVGAADASATIYLSLNVQS